MSSNAMQAADLESLGRQVETLAAEVQRARNEKSEDLDARARLLDVIDDLRAEVVGPTNFPLTLFSPPEFAAMQVAFQREIFQKVPLAAETSIHARDLAALAKMDEHLLIRIMRCLAANKIFVEVAEKVFAHTPVSAAQREGYGAAFTGSTLSDLYKASSSLADAIDTGKASAWEARFGMPLYEYFEKTGSDRDFMAKAMVERSTLEREELATLFPWQDFRKVVDIGGSAGHFVATLAKHHPHLHAVSQDLPGTIADARDRVSKLPPEEAAAYSRVEFEAYDYYTPQPRTDADAFMISHCLHNNLDPGCIRILKAVVPGLVHGGPNARLLICEKLLPAWDPSRVRNKTKMLLRVDISMMISSGGKERSLKDFEALIKAADERFEVDRVYYGRDHSAVLSVKLVQHDLGSTQIPNTSLNDALYGTTNGDSANVTGNHSDVVEELKDAQTDVLAS